MKYKVGSTVWTKFGFSLVRARVIDLTDDGEYVVKLLFVGEICIMSEKQLHNRTDRSIDFFIEHPIVVGIAAVAATIIMVILS